MFTGLRITSYSNSRSKIVIVTFQQTIILGATHILVAWDVNFNFFRTPLKKLLNSLRYVKKYEILPLETCQGYQWVNLIMADFSKLGQKWAQSLILVIW